MARMVWGRELGVEDRLRVLRQYVNRYTGDHTPRWVETAKKLGPCPLQFADDEDWLNNTEFYVTESGKIDNRYRHCESYPTFPDEKKADASAR